MNIEFDDTCWASIEDEWNRGLIELLMLLVNRPQHSLLANPALMRDWINKYLILYGDYFTTRLAFSQSRANALKVKISIDGINQILGIPPWKITARAAYDLVSRPLKLVLENDHSDRMFVESTVPSFSGWCSNGWIEPTMGGGSAMKKDIQSTGSNDVARWRTFYLFDSDRLHPAELINNWSPPPGDGCQGYHFETACASMPQGRWHRLSRRSIENYLPEVILSAKNPTMALNLFDASVGNMAHFYNFKLGLAGDGVYPLNPKKTVRVSRSQGFWTSLSASSILALESGFGSNISEEFNNVPVNHAWPAPILNEMNSFSDALQDAM